MKKVIFIVLMLIFMVPASAKVAKFDPDVYTENPKAIVDEIMQKIKNPHLKKKLLTLEYEVEVEAKKQNRIGD